MDSDFQPAKRPDKSVRPKLDTVSDTPKADDSNAFRTPEETAAADDVTEPAGLVKQVSDDMAADDKHDSDKPKPPKKSWREKLALHWPPGKKEYIVAAAAVVILGLVGAFIALHHAKKPAPKPQIKKIVKPVPSKTVASTLTGLQVDPSTNLRPVTGVMIENSTDARPQSGLGQAGVVFEAIAEGGITRFLALYQDTAPDNIGPIRSARPYYLEWALGFDAALAHVGGSPEALADIKAWNVRDLDQFANGGSYHRVSSRAAPHNVYTSIATLNQLEAAKGYIHSSFSGFARIKTKPTPAKVPTAKTIDIAISGPLYNVHYDYNAATNTYNRSEGGAPHIDANTNAQISPTVVITMTMTYGLAADDHHSQYGTIGSGQAYIFQDGTVTSGTWAKTGDKNQITFADATGKPLLLNPGQTWLTAVKATGNVTYAP